MPDNSIPSDKIAKYQKQIKRLVLSPNRTILELGEKVILAALAYGDDDQLLAGVQPTLHAYNTDNEKEAQISPSGEFTALSPGEYKIVVEVGEVHADATVIVNEGIRRDFNLEAVKPLSDPNCANMPLDVSTDVNATNTSSRMKMLAMASGKAPVWDENLRRAVLAPENNRGNQSFGTVQQALDIPISSGTRLVSNPLSKNYNFTVSILNLPGRGLSVSLDLVYNSLLWTLVPDFESQIVKDEGDAYFDIEKDWPAPGWSLGFGKIIFSPTYDVILVDNDGTRHSFNQSFSFGSWQVAMSNDGSLIDVYFGISQNRRPYHVIARYSNGTMVEYSAYGHSTEFMYPTRIIDRNGNYITITYRNNIGPEIETITDTVGRIIQFHYDSAKLLTAITGPGLNHTSRTLARLHYQTKLVIAGFNNNIIPHVPAHVALLDAIYFPDTSSGYWFGDPDSISSYGMIVKVCKQRSMSFSGAPLNFQGTVTPGVMTRQQVYNYPLTPDYSLWIAPGYNKVTDTWERMTSRPAVTQFFVFLEFGRNIRVNNRSIRVISRRTITTIHPDYHRTVVVTNEKGQVVQEDTFEGNYPSRKRLRSVLTTWDGSRKRTIQVIDELGQTLTQEYFYGPQADQIIEVRDYDYDGITVLRRQVTEYEQQVEYHNSHIFKLPKVVEIYEGNATVPASRTEYSYDDLPSENTPHDPPLKNTPGVVQHLDPMTAFRGNLTRVKTFADAVQRTGEQIKEFNYDDTGNIVKIICSSCEQTKFVYDMFTQYMVPTVIQRGDPSLGAAYQITTQSSYDVSTGLKLTDVDANGLTTQYTYSPASLRLEKVEYPTRAATEYSYDDGNRMVTEKVLDEVGVIAAQYVRRYDGLGSVIRETFLRELGVRYFVDRQYDILGRLCKQSLPYDISKISMADIKWREIFYDDLGRIIQQVASDGSISQVQYNNPARPDGASPAQGTLVYITDPWGRQRWMRNDALGRLVEVIEPDPSGDGQFNRSENIPYYYQYNTLGQLIETRQGGIGGQVRKFRYDSLGRLTHQALPEKSATLNDHGRYNQSDSKWSDLFFYDNHSRLVAHLDARGVQKIFDYAGDPLNRLYSIEYSLNQFGDIANPVVTAPKVVYEYMPSGDVTRLQKITTDGVCAEEFSYDDFARLTSKTIILDEYEAYPFKIDYRYDGVNRVKEIIYPVEYGRLSASPDHTHLDIPRRVAKIDFGMDSLPNRLQMDDTTYASATIYNASRLLDRLTIGSAGGPQVTETYNYDPQTGLLVNQLVRRGDTTLMDLSYDYLRPGRNGRTGQLTRMVDNLDHSMDRSYFYDGLGRLASFAAGNPIHPDWIQTYSYDIYGNRLGAWFTFIGGGRPIPLPHPDLPFDRDNPPAPMLAPPLDPMPSDSSNHFTPLPEPIDPENPRRPMPVVFPETLDGAAQWMVDPQSNHIITPGYSYDAAGNQTGTLRSDGNRQTYQYDAAGRLVNVFDQNGKVLESYTYASDNRRLSAQKGEFLEEVTTYFVWDNNTLLAEYHVTRGIDIPDRSLLKIASIMNWSKNYVYFVNRLLATLEPHGSEDKILFYHPDRLGTRLISQLSDPVVAEQTTLPFGMLPRGATKHSGNPLFTTYDRSAMTGLDYAINRTYDPYQGRFMQVDPLGMKAASLLNPQSLNMYVYVGNDPVNVIDPTGLKDEQRKLKECTIDQDGWKICTYSDGYTEIYDPQGNPVGLAGPEIEVKGKAPKESRTDFMHEEATRSDFHREGKGGGNNKKPGKAQIITDQVCQGSELYERERLGEFGPQISTDARTNEEIAVDSARYANWQKWNTVYPGITPVWAGWIQGFQDATYALRVASSMGGLRKSTVQPIVLPGGGAFTPFGTPYPNPNSPNSNSCNR